MTGCARTCLSALIVAAAALPACGAGTPIARGFDSREKLPIRDSTLSLRAIGSNFVVYSTFDDGGANYWSLDLTTGRVVPVQVLVAPDGGTDAGSGSACAIGAGGGGDAAASGVGDGGDATVNGSTVTVTDPQTGQQTTVDGVTAILHCPDSISPTLTILRSGPTGTPTLWSGPAAELAQISLSIAIAEVVYPIAEGTQPGGATAGAVLAFGAFPAQPSALGLFSIDLTTFAVTELVPPTLGTAAWANGAAGMGAPLASSTLLAQPGTVRSFAGTYTYERTMGDGSTILFAGPFPWGSASELALFTIAPSATVTGLPQGVTWQGTAVNLLAWQDQDAASQDLSLFVWDADDQQFLSCSLPGPLANFGIASPDGTKILFGATTPGNAGGALVLVALGGSGPGGSGTCTSLASANTTNAEFSPDGGQLFWLTGQTLWTAAADGTDARIIWVGDIFYPEFTAGTHLFFELGGGELFSVDLLWVDVTDTSNTPHYLAEQVSESIYAVDPTDSYGEYAWWIVRYDLNLQTLVGTLGLVDTDSGNKRLISPEVEEYLVSSGTPADGGVSADGGASLAQVVYVVRGRNPSSQDGIWVATIHRADLP